ncbi:MAG: sulfurtransferase [Bacillales bacterium]|jgi:rhodanese-related sulfurtransferase|nr:sulfurtransferase [Bacillales bacterium]
MKKILTITIASIFLLLTGCNSTNLVKQINTDEASKMIGKKDTILIDCRTPEEYASGHIPGAMLLPLDELEKNVGELDTDKTYVVICRSGNRSTTFTDSLNSKGFKDVYNVQGGMNEWSGEIVTGNN